MRLCSQEEAEAEVQITASLYIHKSITDISHIIPAPSIFHLALRASCLEAVISQRTCAQGLTMNFISYL